MKILLGSQPFAWYPHIGHGGSGSCHSGCWLTHLEEHTPPRYLRTVVELTQYTHVDYSIEREKTWHLHTHLVSFIPLRGANLWGCWTPPAVWSWPPPPGRLHFQCRSAVWNVAWSHSCRTSPQEHCTVGRYGAYFHLNIKVDLNSDVAYFAPCVYLDAFLPNHLVDFNVDVFLTWPDNNATGQMT